MSVAHILQIVKIVILVGLFAVNTVGIYPLPSAQAKPAATGAMADPDFANAIKAANNRIAKYDAAVKSGDSARIRQAALEVQKDPLAVRQVNNTKPPEYIQKINEPINSVQAKTKELVRQRLAKKLGVDPSRIDFFEATNPSADPKMGQDWDVTARLDGKQIDYKQTQDVVAESFYEAAKGKKPRSTKVANKFAHAQNVEVTNYAHPEAMGSGGDVSYVDPKTGKRVRGTTGEAIILGEKGAPINDPQQLSQVSDYKANAARARAEEILAKAEAKIKSQGLSGAKAEKVRAAARAESQAWQLEQQRQGVKGVQKQVEPRLGVQRDPTTGKVIEGTDKLSPRTRDAVTAMEDVVAGNKSPGQARSEIERMGTTPERVIESATGNIEAGQKLGESPSQRIDRANAGQGTQDVLPQNVQDQMDIKGRGTGKGPRGVPEGGLSTSSHLDVDGKAPTTRLEEIRARAQASGQTGKGVPAGGAASTGIKGAAAQVGGALMRAADAAGVAAIGAEGIQQERERAAEEGRETSTLEAGAAAVRTAFGGHGYDESKRVAEEEIAKSDAIGQGRGWAAARAVGQRVEDFSNLPTTIYEGMRDQSQSNLNDEMAREVEAAAREGREASAIVPSMRAAARSAGDLTGFSRVADATVYTEADDQAARAAARQKEKVHQNAVATLNAAVDKVQKLEDRINALIANWDISDPAIAGELSVLKAQYAAEKATMLAQSAKIKGSGTVDHSDPALRFAQGRAAGFPETPWAAAEAQRTVQIERQKAEAEAKKAEEEAKRAEEEAKAAELDEGAAAMGLVPSPGCSLFGPSLMDDDMFAGADNVSRKSSTGVSSKDAQMAIGKPTAPKPTPMVEGHHHAE